jgi:hypothetical protein
MIFFLFLETYGRRNNLKDKFSIQKGRIIEKLKITNSFLENFKLI